MKGNSRNSSRRQQAVQKTCCWQRAQMSFSYYGGFSSVGNPIPRFIQRNPAALTGARATSAPNEASRFNFSTALHLKRYIAPMILNELSVQNEKDNTHQTWARFNPYTCAPIVPACRLIEFAYSHLIVRGVPKAQFLSNMFLKLRLWCHQ